MGELIGAAQAAKEAGVNRQYILNLIQEGILEAQLVSRQYVIERASFDAWLARRRARQAEQGKAEQDKAEQEHNLATWGIHVRSDGSQVGGGEYASEEDIAEGKEWTASISGR